MKYLESEIKRAEDCGIFELGNDWEQAHHMGMKKALIIIKSDLIKKKGDVECLAGWCNHRICNRSNIHIHSI